MPYSEMTKTNARSWLVNQLHRVDILIDNDMTTDDNTNLSSLIGEQIAIRSLLEEVETAPEGVDLAYIFDDYAYRTEAAYARHAQDGFSDSMFWISMAAANICAELIEGRVGGTQWT